MSGSAAPGRRWPAGGLLRCGCGLRVKWADGETGDGQGPGGELEIEWDEKNNRVYMTGPAETVFEGCVED